MYYKPSLKYLSTGFICILQYTLKMLAVKKFGSLIIDPFIKCLLENQHILEKVQITIFIYQHKNFIFKGHDKISENQHTRQKHKQDKYIPFPNL